MADKRKKEPDPPAPAPAPEKGKVSAAILEELKTIKDQNDKILAALKTKGPKPTRQNMYGEDEEE